MYGKNILELGNRYNKRVIMDEIKSPEKPLRCKPHRR